MSWTTLLVIAVPVSKECSFSCVEFSDESKTLSTGANANDNSHWNDGLNWTGFNPLLQTQCL